MKLVYRIENLDCAHCAGEIERAIAKLDGIESVSLDFPSKLLHLSTAHPEGVLAQIQAAADSIEDGVVFQEKERGAAHEHHHGADRGEVLRLLLGAGLFAIGMALHLLPVHPYLPKGLLLAAYLIMGAGVLYNSLRSIRKGQIFDENFLMTIATVGALFLGCWEEAAGVMLFFRVGELFEHLAVERSRRSVLDAIDMRPETACLLRDGEELTIPAEQIQSGDLLRVHSGSRIPVDGIIEAGECWLNTSSVTGEHAPRPAASGDAVLAGCVTVGGALEMRATAGVSDSMVQRILDSVENAAAGKPRLDRFITRFARIYTPIVVAIAGLTAIIPSLVTGDWHKWIYTALNFLMISCPCALILSVPLSFFTGIGAGSRSGILFKDGVSLEALDKVNVVVMDKTGTLTEGSFSVCEVLGEDTTQLLAVCAACESGSIHPIAQGILSEAKARGIAIEHPEHFQEIAGKGVTAQLEAGTAVCGSARLLSEHGIAVPERPEIGVSVHVGLNGVYLGRVTLSDNIKAGAKTSMTALRDSGLHLVMLTGDTLENAQEVAYALAIPEMHAALLPDEKLTLMQQIREEHGSVLFVGDGINDAPVLSGADVGAAMGSGADAAMEAADVVFLGSDPEAIVKALHIARRVSATAKGCIAFALAVKLLVMVLGLLGFANMWLSVFADTGVTILCVLLVLWRIHFYYKKRS